MHEYNRDITHAHLDSRSSKIFDKEEFSHYLVASEGKSNDVANRVTTDIIKFFNIVPQASDATHLDIILHIPTLVEYIHMLKEKT